MRTRNTKLSPVFLVMFLLVVALFGVSMCASAATITWTNPTTRADGTPLHWSELLYSDVQIGTCSGLAFGEMLDSKQVAAPTGTLEYAFSAGTSCVRVLSVDSMLRVSDPSNVFSYVLQANPPNPPGVLHVIWGGAFKMRVMPNGRIFLPYETGESARYGAPCLAIPGLTEEYGFGLSEGIIAICGE